MEIVGVALATVTETVVVAVLKLAASVGVNVTPCAVEPALGAVDGVVNANAPATVVLLEEADPPESVELANV